MTTFDERLALVASSSFKHPCKSAATSNVTLSGEQTVDGRGVVAGDRVLLTGQSSGAENGVWVVSAGDWTRPLDFDETREFYSGDLVFVQNPSGSSALWNLTSAASPFVLGTSAITAEILKNFDVLNENNMASDSAAAAPSQGSVKAYTDTQAATVTDLLIDEDDMSSDSDSLVPSQQSVKAYVDAQTYTGRANVITKHLVDGTHTFNENCLFALVRVQAGGGGGGGGDNGDETQGGSGASGGYVEGFVDVAADSIETATIVVGSEGAGGVTNLVGVSGEGSAYSDGTNTFSAGGGEGGAREDSADIAAGGTAAGGFINASGKSGLTGQYTWTVGYMNHGANSLLGQGGIASNQTASTRHASGYGAGGAGGNGNGSVADETGGDGSPGIIIVTEYLQ